MLDLELSEASQNVSSFRRLFFISLYLSYLNFIYFFKYKTIETHARTFLTLNILAIGIVQAGPVWQWILCGWPSNEECKVLTNSAFHFF